MLLLPDPVREAAVIYLRSMLFVNAWLTKCIHLATIRLTAGLRRIRNKDGIKESWLRGGLPRAVYCNGLTSSP